MSLLSERERNIDKWLTLGLVLLAALLYVPYLGASPLWDPWEAHYSQVAMEMIWKNSWWEAWYRNSSRSFWSKPILTFWLMISSLKTFRIAQVGDFAQAEFFFRLPIALVGAVGIGFFFFFVRRLWNRTLAIVASLVLLTSPQYFLISRQVMVDIPYVVIQTIALGFLALGIFYKEPEDTPKMMQESTQFYLKLGGFFLAIQMAEAFFWKYRLGHSWEATLREGSWLWTALAIFFVVWAFVRQYVSKPQTRYFYLFFFFSGLAFLAKGLLSIVIPGGIVLFYILLTGDWDLLRRIRLFYVSEKISFKYSVLLGSISSLLAIWFISYPMYKVQGTSGVWKDLIYLQFKAGSHKIYPFFWLKGLFKSFDHYVVYPLTKYPISTQIYIFIALFLAMAILFALFSKERKEVLKAYFFPGTLLYLIVAGSWVVVMNFKHGLPFMREWFIYHHFSRLAGTIEKPNSSFELYIKQIGFGMFPWAALIPIALVRFLRWSWKDILTNNRRRNLFIFLWFFFPYFFFTFSSTKFHHYIFPVVPPLAMIIGAWLSRLFREDGVLKERIGVGTSILLFVLLAKDLSSNFKPLHQLFTYYYTRTTPAEVYPKKLFTFIFIFIFLAFVTIYLVRRIRFYHFGFLMVFVFLFVSFVNFRLMPAIAPNYSYKSLYMSYKKFDKGRHLPFGEYSNWDERSTSFYFQNFSQYLGRQSVARRFLQRATPKRPVFIMVSKRQIPMLRRLAKRVGKNIYIVDEPHYDMILVSTSPIGKNTVKVHLPAPPKMTGPGWKRVRINFGNKIEMIGVHVDKPKGYKRGQKVRIRFVYKVLHELRRDWKVFIHADPVKWTRHRQNWDHEFAEGMLRPTEWKKGWIVQDIVVRRIPRNFPIYYSRLHIYMGFWLGSERLPIISSSVYTDGQNRARPIVLKLVP